MTTAERRIPMSATKTIREINLELANKLAREGKNNPQAPYYGKFVGIANGQVVVVADNWDELGRQLSEIEPDPTRVAAVDVGYDPDTVHPV